MVDKLTEAAFDRLKYLLEESLAQVSTAITTEDLDGRATAIYMAAVDVDDAKKWLDWLLGSVELQEGALSEGGMKLWCSGMNMVVARDEQEAMSVLGKAAVFTSSEAERWRKDHPWEEVPDTILKYEGRDVTRQEICAQHKVPAFLGTNWEV